MSWSVGMTNLHILSLDSKCYTFDSRANGYARGEGMAALILKPLSDVIQDGDMLFVGSIKTNIGHLEGASGLAALIKVGMSLEKGVITLNLHFEKGNPAIGFGGWRIRFPTEVTPWPMSGLRRASVSDFGYGGTNGHVILTTPTTTCWNGDYKASIRAVFPMATILKSRDIPVYYLSAHDPASARDSAKLYAYTDISSGLFEQAAEKFSGWGDMTEYAKLDIEQDPETQSGFKDRRFDMIIAPNILHATYDIHSTISNARKLRRSGEKLVLLDMTHSMIALARIWTLQKNNFTDLQASSPDVLNPLEEKTKLMIATSIESKSGANGSTALSHALIVTPNAISPENDLIKA
ncbi:Highly reducing polyketide synthase, partial [Lachnellula willkommii]